MFLYIESNLFKARLNEPCWFWKRLSSVMSFFGRVYFLPFSSTSSSTSFFLVIVLLLFFWVSLSFFFYCLLLSFCSPSSCFLSFLPLVLLIFFPFPLRSSHTLQTSSSFFFSSVFTSSLFWYPFSCLSSTFSLSLLFLLFILNICPLPSPERPGRGRGNNTHPPWMSHGKQSPPWLNGPLQTWPGPAS